MKPPRMRPSTYGSSLRFICAWGLGDQRALSQQLQALMQWLPQIDGLDGAWSVVRRTDWKVTLCESSEEVAVAIELGRSADSSLPPGSPVCAYQSFFLGPLHAYRASLRVEIWQGADGALPANQLQLIVHPALDVLTSRQILLGLVGFLKPAWAAAGPEKRPPQIVAAARPAAGWLTYLSSSYGVPNGLPKAAQVSSMKSLGVLVQATPELLDADDAAHVEALHSVERALCESDG